MKYDCAVIGGGAAGMTAAITAARRGKKVCIIERADEPGKKILRTGNGRCNITHAPVNAGDYPDSCKSFVAETLKEFSQADTLEFFKSIGIYTCERDGYVYPMSKTALSVRNALTDACRGLGVEIFTGETLKELREGFLIKTDKGEKTSASVIVATGSCASGKSMSDEGLAALERLDVKTGKRLPALVRLISSDRTLNRATGTRHNAEVVLRAGEEKVARDTGEIQFCADGISGIPVFQVSREAAILIDKGEKVTADMDLAPDLTADEIKAYIKQGIDDMPYRTIRNFFSGIIPAKLVAAVSDKAGISNERKLGDADEDKVFELGRIIKKYSVDIEDTAGIKEAQVCTGGVLLGEINPKTMGHKDIRGLFFAGEIVDVDGPCGGYNLQWAWSSGAVAGKNV